MRRAVQIIVLTTLAPIVPGPSWASALEQQECQVVQLENRVELHSPFFVFYLDTKAGLRAESWTNRLTGKTISLGGGAELAVDIGLPDGPLLTPQWQVTQTPSENRATTGQAVFRLTADEPELSALVTYRWDAEEPVLRKFVEIKNESGRELDRLLETFRPDVVHMDSLDLSAYLPALRGLPVVVTHHNVESRLLARRAGGEASRDCCRACSARNERSARRRRNPHARKLDRTPAAAGYF